MPSIILYGSPSITESIDEYIAAGGFSALAKAVTEMTPQDVIDEVTRSGLRGRGGAGFPAGKKWSQVARQAEKTRYVVCNGDEGDPGAFMDGSVISVRAERRLWKHGDLPRPIP